MNNNDELDDWIKELSETKEQLGRLSEQLKHLDEQNYQGMIGRIQHLQNRLDAIKNWIKRINK